MTRVLIFDHELMDVIEMERLLKAASFEVAILTGPYGVLSKLDYERPDILFFNPDMPNTDSDALLEAIRSSPAMRNMVIIAMCRGDAEAVEDYCLGQNLHGYYMKDDGYAGFIPFVENYI